MNNREFVSIDLKSLELVAGGDKEAAYLRCLQKAAIPPTPNQEGGAWKKDKELICFGEWARANNAE